jgi:integrase
MASVFKRKRNHPIPGGAQIVASRGKRYAKWTDGRGRSRRAPLNDAGDRIIIESQKWIIVYSTASGERRTVTGASDYEVSKRMAVKLESDEVQYRYGARDRRQDRLREAASKPMKQHRDEFEQKMGAEGCSQVHIDGTIGNIQRIAKAQGIERIDQITADRINQFADAMRQAGKAPRTIHSYLTAIKSFTLWLVAEGKLIGDPLAGVKKPSPQREQERRMLLPSEFQRLQDAARKHGERYGMTGDERAMLYDFAIQTGLRAGEIRALRCTDLHLDGDAPYVLARPSTTKNRKEAQQYILAGMASQLREHMKVKMPAAPVFKLPSRSNLPVMLRADMAAARAAWLAEAVDEPDEYRRREQSDFLNITNHAGQVLDFHALRHTCGAWAAKAGAHPKEVQTLMRHSSITLTMDTYGHLFPGQAASTVQRLAVFHPQVDTLRMTGTDDAPAKLTAHAQRASDTQRRESAQSRKVATGTYGDATPLMQHKSTQRRESAQSDTSAGVAALADAPDFKTVSFGFSFLKLKQ